MPPSINWIPKQKVILKENRKLFKPSVLYFLPNSRSGGFCLLLRLYLLMRGEERLGGGRSTKVHLGLDH